MKFLLLIFKNLLRNPLRTVLTSVAIFVLVLVVTFIWSILSFLDTVTAERSKDFKAIVTEKWQIPSQMPLTYLLPLSRGAARSATDERPQDYMSWQFYGGSTEQDSKKRTRENIVFFFGMDPRKLRSMMEDLENLDQALVEKLVKDDQAVILGRDRLRKIGKRVGDTFTVYSMNYPEINLEFRIAGLFPEGRYDDSAVMNMDYLKRSLDDYERKKQKKHPLAEKTLNLVWLKVPDSKAFGRISEQIETSVEFKQQPVRCETASSGIANFLEAYRDLIWGMRWLLSPAILICMALIIANAISISVRERRPEMAIFKVLGFRPWQILVLVLGEALLVGAICGLISTSLAYWFINVVLGGFKFPIAFFPAFRIADNALWWGVTIGTLTALAGSLVPAWSARTVKVSEVFSKVA
jgi:putative ABC transport system permease protein